MGSLQEKHDNNSVHAGAVRLSAGRCHYLRDRCAMWSYLYVCFHSFLNQNFNHSTCLGSISVVRPLLQNVYITKAKHIRSPIFTSCTLLAQTLIDFTYVTNPSHTRLSWMRSPCLPSAGRPSLRTHAPKTIYCARFPQSALAISSCVDPYFIPPTAHTQAHPSIKSDSVP